MITCFISYLLLYLILLPSQYFIKMSLVWLTGFSGSGKSTIAEKIREKTGAPVIDGDIVRKYMVTGGGIHGVEGQQANQQERIVLALQLLGENPLVVAAFVSPKKELRDQVKQAIEEQGYRFILVHVNTSIEVCKQRDPKKLYHKLDNGEKIFLAGMNVSYDVPMNTALVCDTEKNSVEECAKKILKHLA